MKNEYSALHAGGHRFDSDILHNKSHSQLTCLWLFLYCLSTERFTPF